jgi:hypothetical protein
MEKDALFAGKSWKDFKSLAKIELDGDSLQTSCVPVGTKGIK